MVDRFKAGFQLLFSIICYNNDAKLHLLSITDLGVSLQRIHFKFLDVFVTIESDWDELTEVLEKDFWAFKTEKALAKEVFSLKIVKSKNRLEFPSVAATSQSQTAISYDFGQKRYCDYYGKAVTCMDFSKEEAILQSDDFDKSHEVAYLLILSRVGKKLDLHGFHKLHAFAVSYRGVAIVCMMPSKGGKSTLLMELLRNPEIKMLSDDIPLISTSGLLYAFPLKLGLNEIPDHLNIHDGPSNLYEMKRTLYGVKKLLCVRGLPGRVEMPGTYFFKDVYLFNGQRFNSKQSFIRRISWPQTFMGLMKHGVLGLGTPMVMEYFWESGIKDFLVKTRIFFSRLSAFLNLSFKCKRLGLDLGTDPRLAAVEILEYVDKIK